MYIQCTKKLLDRLGRLYEKLSTPPIPIYCWHSSCFESRGVQYVVLVNDQSGAEYSFMIPSFQDFDKLVLETLKNAMVDDHLTPDEIAWYWEQAGPIAIGPTGDPSLVAALSHHTRRLKEAHAPRFLFPEVVPSMFDENSLENSLDAAFTRAFDKLMENLNHPIAKAKSKGPKKVFSANSLGLDTTPMIALDAELMLYREEKVRRSFLMPLEMDFGTLSTIIQIGFGWGENSDHEFHLKSDTIRIGADRSDMCVRLMFEGKHTEVLMEGETLLSDFIPGVRKIKYHFDFNRGWLLDLTVKKAPDADGEPYVECTGGQGTTPPEDCGGPPGYDELCEILSDPTHDEYAETLEWVHDNRNAQFDLKRINTKLKKLKFVDGTR